MLRAIKYTLLGFIGLSILLLILVVDLSPSIEVSSSEQVDQANRMNILLNQVRKAVRERYIPHQITLTSSQAVSLAGFVQRALVHAQADVLFDQDLAILHASYKLTPLGIPLYINLEAEVSSGEGVIFEHVKVGNLTLPGNLALNMAEYVANQYTQSVVATKAIESIASVEVNTSGVMVSVNPLDTLLREFKQIKTGSSDDDDRLLKIKIAHYLRLLDSIDSIAELTSNTPSLSLYLRALMIEAQALSANSSATLENEAAILALAIFAGDRRFSALIGDLSFAIDKIPTTRNRLQLASRQDLSLHFIFSAAIKLLSEQGISIAVGEFKELMDRGQGGSGYSFVDLCADLAGTHFAALAVNPRSARQLQTIMAAEASEALFFPSIEALDEGLNSAEFSDKYQAVDSPAYLGALEIINSRIEALPISSAKR
ncbi:hypothetical protein KJ365_05395 [Glaciecola sp. XM2]|jgi:hypothetical protein|uniref:hypothetical protein n=1 Tax=Glaciecola sp. XM2 TaxID=1914931 RepID=UPI001BDF197C|nr:hypothetical protein [Glaciecola sp. XM2]MBT1450308.1 hypothetical protein [Glaciecola sp. XM2]